MTSIARRRPLHLALALAAALTACRRGAPEHQADLVVATIADYDGLARTAAGRWQAAHPGRSVEVLTLQAADFANAMLPRIYSGNGVPDLLVVDAAFLVRAGGDAFVDLAAPPYADARFLAGLHPQALAAGRSERGAQIGLPAAISPALLYYRQDLAARAGVTEAALSGSWEDLVAAGVKVKGATGAYLLPQLGDLVYASLLSQVEPGASVFFGPRAVGDPLRLQGPAFERAFALARAARAAELTSRLVPGSPDFAKAVEKGLLFAVLGGPGALRQLAYGAPDTAGAWRAARPPAPLPAEAIYFAVPARGQRRAVAWEVIQGALTREGQHAAFADATAYPALLAAQADPLLDEPVRFLGGQRLGALWREAAARAPGHVPRRRDSVAAGAMEVALDQVTEQGVDPRAALAAAEADARKRLARLR